MSVTDAFRRILVVEDSLETQDVLLQLLQPLGVRLTTAMNGFEAIDQLLSQPFEAVLTDYMMPEINGIELLERMKHAGLEIPVVLITGFGDQRLILEALQLGVVNYLEKPFIGTEVREVMGRAAEIGFRRRRIEAIRHEAYESGRPLREDLREQLLNDQHVISLLQLNRRKPSRAS